MTPSLLLASVHLVLKNKKNNPNSVNNIPSYE